MGKRFHATPLLRCGGFGITSGRKNPICRENPICCDGFEIRRNLRRGFPNPQARKGLHEAGNDIYRQAESFFGLKILIFHCVGLQIPRGKQVVERFLRSPCGGHNGRLFPSRNGSVGVRPPPPLRGSSPCGAGTVLAAAWRTKGSLRPRPPARAISPRTTGCAGPPCCSAAGSFRPFDRRSCLRRGRCRVPFHGGGEARIDVRRAFGHAAYLQRTAA